MAIIGSMAVSVVAKMSQFQRGMKAGRADVRGLAADSRQATGSIAGSFESLDSLMHRLLDNLLRVSPAILDLVPAAVEFGGAAYRSMAAVTSAATSSAAAIATAAAASAASARAGGAKIVASAVATGAAVVGAARRSSGLVVRTVDRTIVSIVTRVLAARTMIEAAMRDGNARLLGGTQRLGRDIKLLAGQAGGAISGSITRGSAAAASGLAGNLAVMTAGLVGLIAIGGIASHMMLSLNQQQREFIDNLGKTSAKLGIQVEQLQRMGFAGEQTGVQQNTLNTALQRMVRRIAEAKEGSGEALGALRELRLDIEMLARLSPDKQFAAVAAAFQSLPDQATKVRLAFKLFDTEGVALVNTLNLGVDGLNEMAAQADATGSVLAASMVANVERLNDATNRVGKAWDGLTIGMRTRYEGFKAKVLEEFAMSLEQIRDDLRAVGRWFGLVKEAGKADAVIASQQELNSVLNSQIKKQRELTAEEKKRLDIQRRANEERNRQYASNRQSLQDRLSKARLDLAHLGEDGVARQIAELKGQFQGSEYDDLIGPLAETLRLTQARRKEEERIAKVAREQQEHLDGLKQKASQVLDGLKTPMERLIEKTRQLDELRAAGLLTIGQHAAAIGQMQSKLQDGPREPRFTSALREGSKEARTAILRAQGRRGDDKGIEQVATNTEQMAEHLAAIRESLEDKQLEADITTMPW